MSRYEWPEESSNRFWEIVIAGESVTTRWGKIGTEGKTLTKAFSTPEKAKQAAEEKIAEKTRKGYRLAKPGEFAAIINEWKALAGALADDKALSVTATFGGPATPAQIARAEKSRKKQFPASLHQLLAVCNGFELAVRVNGFEDRSPIGYSLSSTRQYDARKDCKGILWFDHDDPDEPQRHFVLIGMSQPEVGYGFHALTKPGADPEVIGHVMGEHFTESGKTLAQHLRGRIETLKEDLAEAKAAVATKKETKAAASAVTGTSASAQLEDAFQISSVNLEHDEDKAKVIVRTTPQDITDLQLYRGPEKEGFDASVFAAFPNLGRLRIQGMPRDADLSPLSRCPKLTEIDFVYQSGSGTLAAAVGSVVFPSVLSIELESPPELGDFRAFAAFPCLQRLEIERFAQPLPADLSFLDTLESFDLSGNDEKVTIPGELKLPASLVALTIERIPLDPPPRFTGGTKLASLKLLRGQLKQMPALSGLEKLTTLTLDNNQISDLRLPAELPSLTTLSVSMNGLVEIATLDEMPRLTCFIAARNKLQSLEGIEKLPALERLGVSENALRAIGNLAGNPKLNDLNLTDNAVKAFDGLSTVADQCRVWLMGNRLDKKKKAELEQTHGKRLILDMR